MARGKYGGAPISDEALLAELRSRLDYDAERGAFFRRDGFTGVKAGDRLGSPDRNGKRQAAFLGTRYLVDQLVWLVETGRRPTGGLNHRNGDNSDDRFSNLVPVATKLAHQFAEKAASRFGSRIDLSQVSYVDCDTKVTMSCPAHGRFDRTPADFLASEAGCPVCCQEAHRSRCRKDPQAKWETRRARHARHEAKRKPYQQAYKKAWAQRNRPAVALRCTLLRTIRKAKLTVSSRDPLVAGYTVEQFKAHIEGLFEPWMSWANHGEWHVDHVKPVSWFLRQGITDPGIINALSNLRPLRAIDNLRKAARVAPEYSTTSNTCNDSVSD